MSYCLECSWHFLRQNTIQVCNIYLVYNRLLIRRRLRLFSDSLSPHYSHSQSRGKNPSKSFSLRNIPPTLKHNVNWATLILIHMSRDTESKSALAWCMFRCCHRDATLVIGWEEGVLRIPGFDWLRGLLRHQAPARSLVGMKISDTSSGGKRN